MLLRFSSSEFTISVLVLLLSAFLLSTGRAAMSQIPEIHVYASGQELEGGLEELLRKTAGEAIAKRNKFFLGVSGGSMVGQLSSAIPRVYEAGQEAWDKWHIFLCDERIVPTDDKDSTFGAFKLNLLKKIPALEAQFVGIDPAKDAEGNARFYQNQLVKHFGNAVWPSFDLLLLGMGPDGHTCSLFPNHPLLKETKLWVAPITDSPKPPSNRITLTLPVLNHAKNVVFVVCGFEKSSILENIFEKENSEKTPAGFVHPETTGGKLIWLLDKEASSKLSQKTVSHKEL